MEIINSLIDFFGVSMLSQSATLTDLIEFIVMLYFAVFVLIAVFRGIITMCTMYK